jgi:hypothetical protein
MFANFGKGQLDKLKASLSVIGESALQPFEDRPKKAATDPPASPAPAAVVEVDEGYVRLPLTAAKKLRFYERDDLTELVDFHAKEKGVLLTENASLRRFIVDKLARAQASLVSCALTISCRARTPWTPC